MTEVPAEAFSLCLCGHTRRRHDDGDGECQAACGCPAFRDEPSIFERAAKSRYAQTRRLGDRIQRLTEQLRARLDIEDQRADIEARVAREQAAAEQEIEALEQRLAQLSRPLTLADPPRRGTRGKPQRCAHCDAPASNEAGLHCHMRARHPEALARAKAERVADLTAGVAG